MPTQSVESDQWDVVGLIADGKLVAEQIVVDEPQIEEDNAVVPHIHAVAPHIHAVVPRIHAVVLHFHAMVLQIHAVVLHIHVVGLHIPAVVPRIQRQAKSSMIDGTSRRQVTLCAIAHEGAIQGAHRVQHVVAIETVPHFAGFQAALIRW